MITSHVQQTKIMTAQQIVQNKDGNEVVLSFGEAPAGVDSNAASVPHMPRYLDDEDENTPPEAPDKVPFWIVIKDLSLHRSMHHPFFLISSGYCDRLLHFLEWSLVSVGG